MLTVAHLGEPFAANADKHDKHDIRGGTAGAPSVLIAYGQQNADTLKACGIAGHYTANTNLNCDASASIPKPCSEES